MLPIAALLLLSAQDLASRMTVEARPTPAIEEGDVGLAAKYPGDVGIEKDPDVVFVEGFEGDVEQTCARWDQAAGKPIMSTSADVPAGSGGKRSLLLTRVAGGTGGYTDGGNFYKSLAQGHDRLYFRHYVKFNEGHAPIHHYGGGFLGIRPASRWPLGHAGLRPKGDHLFSAQVEPGDFTSWYWYCYWQHMGGSPSRGQTWGNTFEVEVAPRPVAREKWICLEIMLKMNDVGDTNGEQCYWIDGKLSRKGDLVTSYLGKGFPQSGTWVYDKFIPGVSKDGVAWDDAQKKGVRIEGGKPFPGFAWRSAPDLALNAIWLYRYHSKPETGTSKVWWDHVVVAKKYIGPLQKP